MKKRIAKPAGGPLIDSSDGADSQWDRTENPIGSAVIRSAGVTLKKPGRPKSADAKKSVHLRLSPDVLAYFRKSGPGWQTRMDEALRKAAKLRPRS